MFEIPADAPAWVPVVVWTFFAIFAALFGVLTPRLRALMARVASPPVDATVRALGTAVSVTHDGPKIAHELERIADAAERIAEAAHSIAKMEEQGTQRMLESMQEQLRRLDHRFEGR